MALVTWKALGVDASDVSAVAGFWANALEWTAEELDDGDAIVRGNGPGEEIAVLLVPEARTVKQRVHLDLRAESLERFAGLDQLSETGEFAWTVFADPEGGEFCVFEYDEPPRRRLKTVEVDSVDHKSIAAWWADLFGCAVTHDDGYSSVEPVPGSTLEAIDFATVPEPKAVKNRIHWDVTLADGASVGDLIAAGASLLRSPDDEIGWTVLADPEGNEFCVFENR